MRGLTPRVQVLGKFPKKPKVGIRSTRRGKRRQVDTVGEPYKREKRGEGIGGGQGKRLSGRSSEERVGGHWDKGVERG